MNRTALTILVTVALSLPLGFIVGFLAGVATTDLGEAFLQGALADEEAADIANPQSLSTKRYDIKYAGNWYVAEDDEFFVAEQFFSIDSPGFTYTMFEIWPMESSAVDSTLDSVAPFRDMLNVTRESTFESWGSYSGHGVELEGGSFGSQTKVRVFTHTTESMSFTVTEWIDLETEALVDPGIKLIRESFVLKKPEE